MMMQIADEKICSQRVSLSDQPPKTRSVRSPSPSPCDANIMAAYVMSER